MSLLGGMRVIVTGAAGGIGSETALRLGQAGARVFLADLSSEWPEHLRHGQGIAGFAVGDLTDENAVASLFAEADRVLGGVDGLVNNAGATESPGGTARQSLADWSHTMDSNLKATYLASRQAARVMRSGAIVNVASVAGLCAFPASNAYSVSKAGIVMLTKTLALDLARKRIRVNAVAPGIIDAPMAYAMASDASAQHQLVRRIPMGRFGNSDEVADVIKFLLSKDARYVTGAVIPVDGGWTAFGGAGDASRV
ncbi:MAG: SDR family oxidoreductase [Ectothiorhodospiraceae bacterium]|nr:SDR family oxidoreductase [Ectothiorhodospiraceae bacterium]